MEERKKNTRLPTEDISGAIGKAKDSDANICEKVKDVVNAFVYITPMRTIQLTQYNGQLYGYWLCIPIAVGFY